MLNRLLIAVVVGAVGLGGAYLKGSIDGNAAATARMQREIDAKNAIISEQAGQLRAGEIERQQFLDHMAKTVETLDNEALNDSRSDERRFTADELRRINRGWGE